MDDKDRRLLALLRQNARAPVVALARHLGLSRSATQERLGRLVRSGAIARYTVVEGSPSPTRQSAHLLVRLGTGVACAQVAPRLRGVPGLTAIDSVAGPVDLLVSLDADSAAGIEAARAAVAGTPGVAEVTTLVVLLRHPTP
jgi:Lrp/AsnC family leucine-responsive transcriptional regulator